MVVVLDAAWKTGVRHDHSVAEVWGKSAAEYFLLDELRGKWESPELRRRVALFRETWLPEAEARGLALPLYVEDAGGGTVAIQEFRAATDFPVLAYAPKGASKVARAEAVSPLAEAGKVWIPDARRAAWATAWLGELVGFPELPEDDRCDATAMALHVLRGSAGAARVVVRPREEVAGWGGYY
jgi:predicted phage terminase large subunit-like protein